MKDFQTYQNKKSKVSAGVLIGLTLALASAAVSCCSALYGLGLMPEIDFNVSEISPDVLEETSLPTGSFSF